eukprot:scaffold18589_cov30-Tisochrysis_lutea.AAC.1
MWLELGCGVGWSLGRELLGLVGAWSVDVGAWKSELGCGAWVWMEGLGSEWGSVGVVEARRSKVIVLTQ